MPRQRKFARQHRAPDRLEDWQREVLTCGQVILDSVPESIWRAWRDSGEARATWRKWRRKLLAEFSKDPTEVCGVFVYEQTHTDAEFWQRSSQRHEDRFREYEPFEIAKDHMTAWRH